MIHFLLPERDTGVYGDLRAKLRCAASACESIEWKALRSNSQAAMRPDQSANAEALGSWTAAYGAYC